VLGYCYLSLNSLERAERELEICADLAPDPMILWNIANTLSERAITLQDASTRRQVLEQVYRLLRKRLDMKESTSLPLDDALRKQEWVARGQLVYGLGWICQQLWKYDEAIAYFKIAQVMGYKPLQSLVELSNTYIDAKVYDDAERQCRAALSEAREQYHRLVDADKQEQTAQVSDQSLRFLMLQPAKATREDVPINDLLVQIFVNWAFVLAESGVRLRRAACLLGYAERCIDQATQLDRAYYRALAHDSRGWLCYQERRYAAAIEQLERAVAQARRPHAYLRLASAYVASARSEKRERDVLLQQAREACAHGSEADLTAKYKQQFEGLLQEIRAIESEANRPPASDGQARKQHVRLLMHKADRVVKAEAAATHPAIGDGAAAAPTHKRSSQQGARKGRRTRE
jgi:tetratricopeptide (TPR) repeat protein